MKTLPRSFYIRKGSACVTREGIEAEVYTYETNGRPYAMAFIGKQSKPVWHYNFWNEADRARRIDELFEGVKANQEFKAKRHQERKEFAHTLKTGDILYASWGYDQTNIDFFQITATSAKQVTFREIHLASAGGEGFMCENCVAVPGAFIEKETEHTRTVSKGSEYHPEGSVTFADYPGAYALHLNKWNGKPLYRSWYA